jgi:hypothetical protein
MEAFCKSDYTDIPFTVQSNKVTVAAPDGGVSEPPNESADTPIYMFSDAANHWAKDDINQIARLGLIEGFNDGRFHRTII